MKDLLKFIADKHSSLSIFRTGYRKNADRCYFYSSCFHCFLRIATKDKQKYPQSRGPNTLVNMYITRVTSDCFLSFHQLRIQLRKCYFPSASFCSVRFGCIWSYLKQMHLVVNLKRWLVSDPEPPFLTYTDPEEVQYDEGKIPRL